MTHLPSGLTRRELVKWLALSGTGLALASCGASATATANPGAAGARRFKLEPSVGILTIQDGRAEVEIVELGGRGSANEGPANSSQVQCAARNYIDRKCDAGYRKSSPESSRTL